MNASSPIKVMHIVQYLDIGGLETVVIELCRRLDRQCFTQEICCLGGYDPAYAATFTDGGGAIHVMRKKHRYDLSYFFRVAKFLRKRQVEVLHAHSGCFFYAAIFAMLGGVKKFVFTAHGLPVLNRSQDIIEDNIAGMVCDSVVAVSQEIKDVLVRRIPVTKKKIQVIYNGVDTELFCPFADKNAARQMAQRYNLPENAFVIGSVGRLEPVKNYAMLLRAFSKLSFVDEGLPTPHLVLVGEGSERAKLEQLAADLGVVGNTTFLGMQYAIHEIVPLFHIFVLSSVTEGTSISLLEAQASGVPAVVTDVGGNSSIIKHGMNGFLCPVNDDTAMSTFMSKLWKSSTIKAQLAENSRQVVLEHWGLAGMTHQYEALYARGRSASKREDECTILN